jgi:hypothetical protein
LLLLFLLLFFDDDREEVELEMYVRESEVCAY